MMEAGASVVLEPGFAQLLDIVPPLAAADQPPRGLPGAGPAAAGPAAGGKSVEATVVRRAAISRWVGGLVDEWELGSARGSRRGFFSSSLSRDLERLNTRVR